MKKTTHKTVTIAIPVYNESLFIHSVINGFLSQNHPNLVEILVADGGSTDETANIVNKIADDNPKIRVLHNPYKIQSHALNIMIKAAKGDIFLRADAHCIYSNDYIESCIKSLYESEALNVGGTQRFIAKTAFQSGVALASRSLLGNGGAKYRNPEYRGFADTVFMGCFWRTALLDVSGYSTDVGPNEDAELNQKLLKMQPNSIYISPDIKVWYYPRSSPQALCIQYFRYGRGRYLTAQKHPTQSPIRTKIPSFGLLFLIAFSFLTFKTNPICTILPFAIVLGILGCESIRLTLKYHQNFTDTLWRGSETDIPHPVLRCFYCWIALIIMPIAYTTGGCFQCIRHKLFRVNGW